MFNTAMRYRGGVSNHIQHSTATYGSDVGMAVDTMCVYSVDHLFKILGIVFYYFTSGDYDNILY